MIKLRQDKIQSLDHVALIVHDLANTSKSFEHLGFCVTPVSQHSGAITAGGEVVQWGCANVCIMLQQGYLELMGIINPKLYDNKIPQFLSRYEGIHILAFGCNNPSALSERLSAEGFSKNGVYNLSRKLETPRGTRVAKFNLVRLVPTDMPEGRVLAIRHLTKSYLWQERYMTHRNGASSLEEIVVSVDQPSEAAERYQRFFGISPVKNLESYHFNLGEGNFVLTTSKFLRDNYAIDVPSNPFPAIIKIRSINLNQTRTFLEENSIKHKKIKTGIQISSSETAGATVIFIE